MNIKCEEQGNEMDIKCEEHRVNGVLHKSNGPARIWDNGNEVWFLHGDWPRYYGPSNLFQSLWMIHGTLVE